MTTSISDLGITFADGNAQTYASVPVRQTILSGAVDINGQSAFGGSTGGTTVTANASSGVLVATASSGVSNRTGSITNPVWNGLSTNGTAYLYLDIAANGTCTTGSTPLAPVYQWGGTYGIGAGQNTFNIQEMTMKVGNGSTVTQVYRVFVGEVTIAGGVVTAITWYALMGRYVSAFSAWPPGVGTPISLNSNIGITATIAPIIEAICITAEFGWIVGDIMIPLTSPSPGYITPLQLWHTSKQCGFTTGSNYSLHGQHKTGGFYVALTIANWNYRMIHVRGW